MRRDLLVLGVVVASTLEVASCATGGAFDGEDPTGGGGSVTGVGGDATGTNGSGPGGPGNTSSTGTPECPDDVAEPNDDCQTAKESGSMTDNTTTGIALTGTLTTGDDEDWFVFDTVDVAEAMGNGYHVRVRFAAPAGANTEFSFDIIRGNICATPDAKHSNLKEYDWCVDGSGMAGGLPIGEAGCSAVPSDPNACTDHSMPYLVRVHRDPLYSGAEPGSCLEFSLEISARGGGACDFSGACDAQVSE